MQLRSLTAVIESSQNLNAISEPFTYLSSGIDDEIEGIDDKIDYANFYVYCKNCSKYGKGKLRAYCNLCDSSAIVFLTEPEKWSDVLGSKLSIECNDCLKGNKAHICFKCTECNDVGFYQFFTKTMSIWDFGCIRSLRSERLYNM